MNEEIKNLEPKKLWSIFTDLNAIPRPSKRERKAIEFVKNFGEKLGLETIVDEIGNVIIKKPATPGMENKTPVILQGHVDMVPQKNSGVDHDFDKDGIKMLIDGDWVTADGTTLGADNGIGVSAILAILASDDIPHPPLEGLFTMDEETGMTGAQELKPGLLDGKILLNLDSEDDDEMTIGCAGGIDIVVSSTYQEDNVEEEDIAFEIFVSGLTGGHSGMDIHLYRGNANKIMNRILWRLFKDYNIGIHSIDGGGLRNAIPRESKSIITVDKKLGDDVERKIRELRDEIYNEYKTTDPEINIDIIMVDAPKYMMKGKYVFDLLNSVYACWNGVYRMSPDVEGLTQTSNNLARIIVKNGELKIENLARSSVESEKMDLASTIRSAFSLAGYNIKFEGGYPGWQPDVKASINQVMKDIYKKNFGEEPNITACHAGLECGLIKEKYPNTEMISFGPNIRGPHSPDEKVQISSVQKFWKLLLDTLKSIPDNK
jgi:dipeptidase D